MQVHEHGATGIVSGTVDPDGNRSGGSGYRGVADAGHLGHCVGQRRGFDRGAHRSQAALPHRRDVSERRHPRGGVGIECRKRHLSAGDRCAASTFARSFHRRRDGLLGKQIEPALGGLLEHRLGGRQRIHRCGLDVKHGGALRLSGSDIASVRVDSARRFEDVGYHCARQHGLHVNMVIVTGRLNIQMQAFGQREHCVFAHDVGRLQRNRPHSTDRRQVPHPGLLVGGHHLRQKCPHSEKDSADVDVDDAAPIGHRCVPQVAELFDSGVVHEQPYRTDIPVGLVGELLDGVRIAHVAHDVYRRASRCTEFVPQCRDGAGVNVGQDHSHAQAAGVSRQSGTDPGAGPSDDGDAARECFACAHEPVALSAVSSASRTEFWVSSTTSISVNTSPVAARRMPTLTTPLDTANGTKLAIWLTRM